ncbi:MAG: thiamine/thiamine pyrophosphate ABC transporter permease [Vibrionaceae bacterium]
MASCADQLAMLSFKHYSFASKISGVAVSAIVAFLTGCAIYALFSQAPDFSFFSLWEDPYIRHVSAFSFKQALLSTLLATLLAIPVALALARRTFYGKPWVLKLFSLLAVLPSLIGIYGIIAIYGNSGLLAAALNYANISIKPNIYGLNGILLAHLFFNLPYASLLFLDALQQIPNEQRRLAQQLGLRGLARFRYLEWPYLSQALPHAAGLIFILCFTSFTTVMTLSGGPKATTLEVAIYQSIRFDFDFATGAQLALWQLTLCALFQLVLNWLRKPFFKQHQTFIQVNVRATVSEKLWDSAWLSGAILFVGAPLLMVVAQGVNTELFTFWTKATLWSAVQNSLFLASGCSLLAFFLGAIIALSAREWRFSQHNKSADLLEGTNVLLLALPSCVLSTGLFLLTRDTKLTEQPLFLLIITNTLMALPYVVKTLSSPAFLLFLQYQKLCQTLGIKGARRLQLLEWQLLRSPIQKALIISFLLSFGDLSAIALFANNDIQTLPFYLFNLLASFHMQEAASCALLLLLLNLAGLLTLEKVLGKTHQNRAPQPQSAYPIDR